MGEQVRLWLLAKVSASPGESRVTASIESGEFRQREGSINAGDVSGVLRQSRAMGVRKEPIATPSSARVPATNALALPAKSRAHPLCADRHGLLA